MGLRSAGGFTEAGGAWSHRLVGNGSNFVSMNGCRLVTTPLCLNLQSKDPFRRREESRATSDQCLYLLHSRLSTPPIHSMVDFPRLSQASQLFVL